MASHRSDVRWYAGFVPLSEMDKSSIGLCSMVGCSWRRTQAIWQSQVSVTSICRISFSEAERHAKRGTKPWKTSLKPGTIVVGRYFYAALGCKCRHLYVVILPVVRSERCDHLFRDSRETLELLQFNRDNRMSKLRQDLSHVPAMCQCSFRKYHEIDAVY